MPLGSLRNKYLVALHTVSWEVVVTVGRGKSHPNTRLCCLPGNGRPSGFFLCVAHVAIGGACISSEWPGHQPCGIHILHTVGKAVPWGWPSCSVACGRTGHSSHRQASQSQQYPAPALT